MCSLSGEAYEPLNCLVPFTFTKVQHKVPPKLGDTLSVLSIATMDGCDGRLSNPFQVFKQDDTRYIVAVLRGELFAPLIYQRKRQAVQCRCLRELQKFRILFKLTDVVITKPWIGNRGRTQQLHLISLDGTDAD